MEENKGLDGSLGPEALHQPDALWPMSLVFDDGNPLFKKTSEEIFEVLAWPRKSCGHSTFGNSIKMQQVYNNHHQGALTGSIAFGLSCRIANLPPQLGLALEQLILFRLVYLKNCSFPNNRINLPL